MGQMGMHETKQTSHRTLSTSTDIRHMHVRHAWHPSLLWRC